MVVATDWLAIDATCPEFKPNVWTFVFAIIAFVGLVLNTILSNRFKSKKDGSVFLGLLAGFDSMICFFYLWVYTVTSIIYAYKSEWLAELRIDSPLIIKAFEVVYESNITFVLFFIIMERYLWTCTPRYRLKFKMFTVARPKFLLLIVTVVYVMVATIITYFKGAELSNVPFCDLALRPVEYENSTLHFLQRYFFPGVLIFVTNITFLLAALTVIRVSLSLVGEGEQPVHQEEINLTFRVEERQTITVSQVKRSIICMLVVYVTFLIRAVAYYVFIDPYTSSMYTKTIQDRNSTMWWYDLMNLIFSASRYIVYYLICRDQMVVEYPLNGLGH